jgi:DNA recombination protein RmuC
MELIYQVLLILIGIVLGCTIAWLLSKKRESIIYDRAKAEADLEKAVIQERLLFRENALAEHKERFEKTERFLAGKEEKNLQLQTRISHLETLLDQERKQSEEKIALLVETKKSQMMEFSSLADRIFDTKGKEITTRNRVDLNNILQPLREQIEGFKKKS